MYFFFFSSRRRHTRLQGDWSSDVCSSDLVSPQMLIEGDEVLLLPAMTRYEQPGGGTETTTERRVVLSPEIPGPRPGEARAEWDIFAEVGRRARPEAAPGLGLRSAAKIRAEI